MKTSLIVLICLFAQLQPVKPLSKVWPILDSQEILISMGALIQGHL